MVGVAGRNIRFPWNENHDDTNWFHFVVLILVVAEEDTVVVECDGGGGGGGGCATNSKSSPYMASPTQIMAEAFRVDMVSQIGSEELILL